MRKTRLAASVTFAVMLAACGGGGGVSSTPPPPTGGGPTPSPSPSPSPTPAPSPSPTPTTPEPTTSPPPTGDTVTQLSADRAFGANSGHTTASFDLDSGTITSGTSDRREVIVAYREEADSYTVYTDTKTILFLPSHIVADETSGSVTTYEQAGSGQEVDRFLLFSRGSAEGGPNADVALGIVQASQIENGVQRSDFDFFVYGFDTPPGEVPTTGRLIYQTELYGVLTIPGEEGRLVQSNDLGLLTVDLETATLEFRNAVEEADFSFASLGNETYSLVGEGRLASAQTGFSGDFTYQGTHTISGDFTGNFFGDSAASVGLAFAGNGTGGVALSGGLTGFGSFGYYTARGTVVGLTESLVRPDDYSSTIRGATAPFNLLNEGVRLYGYLSDVPDVAFAETDADTGSLPGFRSWSDTVDGVDVELAINDPKYGGVELSYLNFGISRYGETSEFFSERESFFFRYGFATPRDALHGRSGTAIYSGIVLGQAVNSDSGSYYAVDGTSRFEIDFSDFSVGGDMTLGGVREGGTLRSNFGTWFIDGALSSNFALFSEYLTLRHESGAPDEQHGFMEAEFFGPNGEEIGAHFEAILPAEVLGEYLNVGGVTVAAED